MCNITTNLLNESRDSNESTTPIPEEAMTTTTNGKQLFATDASIYSIAQTVLGVTGILANSLIIVVFVGFSNVKARIANMLIVNQCVIDLTISILICVPIKFATNLRKDSLVDQFVCRFWISHFVNSMQLLASTNNIVALTMERYLAVVHPVLHKVKCTTKQIYAVIAAVWLIAILFQTLTILSTADIVNGMCTPYWAWPTSTVKVVLTWVVVFPVEVFGPLVIASFCYARMYFVRRKKIAPQLQHVANAAPIAGTSRESPRRQPRVANIATSDEVIMRNILRTLVILIVVYFSCYAPFWIQTAMQDLGYPMDFDSFIPRASSFMVYSTCLINPLIYAIKYTAFKEGFNRMLSKLKPPSNVPHDFTRTTTVQSNYVITMPTL